MNRGQNVKNSVRNVNVIFSSVGLEVCKTESGVLHTKTTTGEVVLLLCFVDDLVLFCNDKALEKKIVSNDDERAA